MDNKYLPIPIANPISRFEPFNAYFDCPSGNFLIIIKFGCRYTFYNIATINTNIFGQYSRHLIVDLIISATLDQKLLDLGTVEP